jgi:hypothetical protein
VDWWNNAGYDLLLGGRKIDVKSGVRHRKVLSEGHDAVATIGIRLNKGVDGLSRQDVDEILVVVRDGYSRSTTDVVMEDAKAHVEMRIDVDGVAVYRIPVKDAARLFKRPFTKAGTQGKRVENVDASVGDLEMFRVKSALAPAAGRDGDVVEFRSGPISGDNK